MRTVELASVLGISRQRINELGRKGKITREADGTWNLEKVRSQLNRTLDSSQIPRVQSRPALHLPNAESESVASGNVHEMFNRARAAKEIALAKREQLELRRREEKLLDAEEAQESWTKTLTAFRERLLLAPDKLAPKVAVCSDVLECRAIIEREIRNILVVLSESKDDAA